jgi:hypothetical protein
MAAGAKVLPFPQRASQGRPEDEDGPRRPVSKLKKQFINAVASKSAENAEAAEAERYFHGVQWDEGDLRTLRDRGQPPITYNRFKRKVNTVVGIQERMRQDPKGYPRNPQPQATEGADLATTVLRYAMGWAWNDLCTQVARRCTVRGISGAELVLTQGDEGDPEVEWLEVDQRDFFYDPKSIRADFDDAIFKGTTRWVDLDTAIGQWPDYEDELNSYIDQGPTGDFERGDERFRLSWVDRKLDRIRIVDHWYKIQGKWFYTIYCGETELEWGASPFVDEKGRSTDKYEMISYETDQDGDRYSSFRDLKSPQDEVNQRRSKSLHLSNSRRVIADSGAVDDVELARREMARADGWVVKNKGFEVNTEDALQAQVLQANMEMLTEAKNEIDTFGPNPSLIGTQIDPASGRAIQLLQAAGIAEMGNYVVAFRHWKLRCYRKTWCAVQKFWTAPRWIRVTDDEKLQQFVQINGWEKDPQTGFPAVINQLAALDVDIIIDEGADSINTMADTFDLLLGMAKSGSPVPPEMLIEMSPLPGKQKQQMIAELQKQQQGPMQMGAIQLKLQQVMAEIEEIKSKTTLNLAQAQKAQADALAPPPGPAGQVDTPADLAKADLDQAKAQEVRHKIQVGAHLPKQEAPAAEQPGLFDLNMARTRREHAQADVADATAAKTALEARTIAEAPPGMLTQPPPVAPGGA